MVREGREQDRGEREGAKEALVHAAFPLLLRPGAEEGGGAKERHALDMVNGFSSFVFLM